MPLRAVSVIYVPNPSQVINFFNFCFSRRYDEGKINSSVSVEAASFRSSSIFHSCQSIPTSATIFRWSRLPTTNEPISPALSRKSCWNVPAQSSQSTSNDSTRATNASSISRTIPRPAQRFQLRPNIRKSIRSTIRNSKSWTISSDWVNIFPFINFNLHLKK